MAPTTTCKCEHLSIPKQVHHRSSLCLQLGLLCLGAGAGARGSRHGLCTSRGSASEGGCNSLLHPGGDLGLLLSGEHPLEGLEDLGGQWLLVYDMCLPLVVNNMSEQIVSNIPCERLHGQYV